jgi:hypothetical protein
MLRGTAAGIVVATFLAASAFGATAIRGRNAARHANSSGQPVAVATTQVTAPTSSPAVSSPAAPSPAAPQPASNAGADSSAKTTNSAPPLAPILPAGESSLADGVTASRANAIVTVSFDKPMIRTRIPEKFEQFVRSTLPRIYGAAIDSSLTRLPIGAIARQGNLVDDLPSSGVRIPIGAAWEVRVFPETRPGVEGPLVVRYRTMVCGINESECAVR